MINSTSDTSILITLLTNHTLHLSITVHRVCGNNSVAADQYQMLLRTIMFHIKNIHFQCHVILNYFVDNSPFSVYFDCTVMNDPTLLRLYCINYLPRHISNACCLVDRISLSSVSHIFIIFTPLKFNKVFMIHGFEFRYILLEEKFPSYIKYPHHENNNLFTVGSRVS